MNNLSWMLYAADVVGNVKIIAAVGMVFCAVWFVGFWVTAVIDVDVVEYDDAKVHRGRALKALPVIIGLACVIIIIPSSSTIYAIAASEVGEQALQTKTAGRALKALDVWLDRQIAGGEDVEVIP